MKTNEILRAGGTDYKNMTKRLLVRSEAAADIPGKDARICIKPNFCVATPASLGATTHPEVTAGIIEYLQENGFRNIVIAEGSWVGDRTSEAFRNCGYLALAEEYGVELFDTQTDGSFSKDCAGMRLKLCNCVRDFDYLINVPVLKGHCQTKITCALKNLKGLIPNEEKRRYHRIGLHEPIAHLNAGIRQDLIVIDHICGDLDFEEGGNPVQRDCVMVAKDPVLVDAYVCAMLGYKTAEVPYVRLAEKLGVGSAELSKLQLVDCNDDSHRGTVEPTVPLCEKTRRVLDVSYAVDEVDSCSACYGSLIPALDQLKQEGLLDRLPCRIAIGQGHRGKTGALGVGDCTSGFDTCIEGCPPSTETILEKLRAFLSRSDTPRSSDNPHLP